MSVLVLILILAFLGAAAWLVNSTGKINGTFKFLINLVLVIVAVVLVLQAFGVWNAVKSVEVPRL